MKKSIFKKYLATSMAIVILSFLSLGISLWIFVSEYWKQEKRELLMENAKAISKILENRIIEHKNGELYIVDSQITQTFITTFASNINAEIFITDTEGQKIFCSEESDCKHASKSVSQNIVDKAMEGLYIESTDLYGTYQNKHYVIGIPVSVETVYGKKNIGVVFTATDTSHLKSFRTDIFNIFLLVAFIAFIIMIVTMSFLSYRMARPLKEMSIAAKSFGNGDFSKRIEVFSKDEVGELAIAFNNMADSLAVSETIRRDFIANVSHELKTPMTTISGFVDGILDGTIPLDRQSYYLNIVSSETKRLSRLVRSMLDLSKIDSEKLKLNKKTFDLSKVIIETLVSFEYKIVAKNVKVSGLQDIKSTLVEGDPDLICQVIYNLIDNAVKFVDTNGEIKILCSFEKKYVYTVVRNSGPGINSEEMNLVFEKFYKTDKSRSQDKNGVGLGLYIVKTIVGLHGGEIKASSVPNEYTEFKFSLPMKLNK